VLIDYNVEYVFISKSSSLRQTEIIEQVKRDPLTNLYNKKIFYDSLLVAMKQCDRVCVAVIDIDNFKTVNDTYGHSVGDIVLVTLADMLKNISSKRILTARYGGEEFSVIFKDMTTFESYTIIENLRKEFSEVKFPQMNNKSVTFSCGLTGDYPNTLSNVEFFNEADQALYYAKSNGKNQTVIYTSLEKK
jgi:diguanylate cyclase (GGDEF)-like protein